MTKIIDRFNRAREISRQKHKDGEAAKLGVLRAGSSGILSDEGEVAGSCVRRSHLRTLGIEIEEISEDKYIMFELGYANEDEIMKQLQTTLGDNEVILREEEIPIQWETSSGSKVSGRPDIVICEEVRTQVAVTADQGYDQITKKPVLGLELKSVHSLWTARDVLFQGKPKLANVIQAAHYMWKLGVPYKLIYKSYSMLGQGMAGTSEGWVANLFPKPGQPMSEYVEYTYYEKKERTVVNKRTGKSELKMTNSKCSREIYESLPQNQRDYGIKQVKQFEVAYDLKADKQGRVFFKNENTEVWTPTIVSLQDIERYFEFTASIPSTGNLGPRPSSVDTVGNKEGYSSCDYCPLKSTCDTHEKAGYNKWLDEVQKVSSSLDKKTR